MRIDWRKTGIALAVATSLLMGCSAKSEADTKSEAHTKSEAYMETGNYEAGDREVTETITNIDIDYTDGQIELTGTDSNTLTVHETANKELTDEQQVHTWVDGTTLHVRYCAPNKVLDFTNVEKRLELAVPKGSELDGLSVDSSSADLSCTDIAASEVNIDVSSGTVRLVSGGDSDKVRIENSSGDIQADLKACKEVSLESSSGDLKLEADEVDNLEVDASSGTCTLLFSTEPHNGSIDSSSGDVSVGLPDPCDLELTLEIDSGEFITNLPFKKSDDTYVCGSGTNKMSISAASGDVSVSHI